MKTEPIRIELLRAHTINGTAHPAGTVLELPIDPATADAWRKKGLIKPGSPSPRPAAPVPASPKEDAKKS